MTMAFKLDKNKVAVATKFQDKEKIKQVGGRKWNPDEKVWTIPKTETALRELTDMFPEVVFEDELEAFYNECLTHSKKLKEVKEQKDTELNLEYASLLRDYQRIGVKFLSEAKFSILADEMGTGKTLQAIAGAEVSGAEKVLIVCPNTLKWNWQREISDWTGKDSIIINGTKKQRKKQLSEAKDYMFIIVNYEALRLEDVFDSVWNMKVDTVICDEAHRLKNKNAKQTKSVAKLSKQDNVERIYLLTGTPMLNRADELWSLLNIMFPKTYTSYWRFVEKFCQSEYNGWGWEVFGGTPQQVEALREELQSVMIRRTKNDVLKELPDKVYQRQTVKLEGQQRKMYDQMEQQAVAKIDEEGEVIAAPVLIAQITRLRQIAISTTLMGGEKLKSAKYDAVKDILADNIDEHKVVIFSQFRAAIDELREVLNAEGYNTVSITGTVSQQDRERATEQFQNNPEVRIMLATIQAGGVGLTWTAADIGIFLDRHWTPAINTQAEDRMHRIGQKNTVEIINLVAQDTVEEWIEDKLRDKATDFDSIIDNGARREKIMEMFQRN